MDHAALSCKVKHAGAARMKSETRPNGMVRARLDWILFLGLRLYEYAGPDLGSRTLRRVATAMDGSRLGMCVAHQVLAWRW